MHGPSCLMATPLPRLNEGATPARALTSHLSQAPGATLPDTNRSRWDGEISPAQRGRVNRYRARNSGRYRGDLRGSGGASSVPERRGQFGRAVLDGDYPELERATCCDFWEVCKTGKPDRGIWMITLCEQYCSDLRARAL